MSNDGKSTAVSTVDMKGLEVETAALICGTGPVTRMTHMFDRDAGTFQPAIFGATGSAPPANPSAEYLAQQKERERRFTVGFSWTILTPSESQYAAAVQCATRWMAAEGPQATLKACGPQTITTPTLKPEYEEQKRALDERNAKRQKEIDHLIERLQQLGCSTDDIFQGHAETAPNAWFDHTSRISYQGAHVTLVFTPTTRLAALLRVS